MGTLYLIDANTPVLLNSEINDTIPVETGDTQVLNGSFPVNVPFGVPIDGTPANLTDLLTQKFSGLLAYYPGYTNIDYDEGIDATEWDPTDSAGVNIGNRGTTSVVYGGYLHSNVVSLSGAAPSAAIITWEVFEITGFLTEDAKDGVMISRYEEVDPSDVAVRVSFDGKSSWTTVTDGVQFNVPVTGTGTNFAIEFWNNSFGKRLWVGSWAVIY